MKDTRSDWGLGRKFVTIAIVIMGSPLLALADDDASTDGRLQGYAKSIAITPSGTAVLWLLLIGLAAVCLGVLFKNAKRTHLD